MVYPVLVLLPTMEPQALVLLHGSLFKLRLDGLKEEPSEGGLWKTIKDIFGFQVFKFNRQTFTSD